jgi:hypothetical protein
MVLYHAAIGLPKWFKAPTGVVAPRYGDHARFEAQVDRYGKIELPKTIDLSKFKVIEVGVDNGKVAKVLFRGPLDATRDLCIVLAANGYVKTVWVNLRSDTHRTLDRSKYAKAA